MNALWEILIASGGGIALAFIIGLIATIAALTMLFSVSAIVVLENFACSAKVSPRMLRVSAGWAVMLTPFCFEILSGNFEALFPRGSWLSLLQTAVIIFLLSIFIQGILSLGLRSFPSFCFGKWFVISVVLAYTLFFGGLGQAGFVTLPALGLLFSLTVALFARRSFSWLGIGLILTAVLGLGIPIAYWGPFPYLSAIGATFFAIVFLVVTLGLFPLAISGFIEARSGYEWFAATRYLFAKRRQTLISIITAICVAGVASGVWLIITVLSVMNGFERTWRDEIIGNRAHFTLQSLLGPIRDYEKVLEVLDGMEGVIGASPYVDSDGMIRGNLGEVVGVRVRGIDPDRIIRVTDLNRDLNSDSRGALRELRETRKKNSLGTAQDRELQESLSTDDPPIIIGSQLAVGLNLELGDEILLVIPFGGAQTPLGPAPRLKRFELVGVFESSFFQYDQTYIYTSLEAAQDFRRIGDVITGVEVRTSDFYRSKQVARKAETLLGSEYYTTDWKDFFPAFFQALKTERIMMFVLLTMIMVVAAFAIVVTLIMMTMEKSKDIAILKTMGSTDLSIERIFAIQGCMIGLLGTFLGVIAGIAVTTQLAWVQRQIENITGIDTLPAAVYQFSTLPWELNFSQIAVVVTLAMVLCLGATLLPSRQAARLDPSDALRSE